MVLALQTEDRPPANAAPDSAARCLRHRVAVALFESSANTCTSSLPRLPHAHLINWPWTADNRCRRAPACRSQEPDHHLLSRGRPGPRPVRGAGGPLAAKLKASGESQNYKPTAVYFVACTLDQNSFPRHRDHPELLRLRREALELEMARGLLAAAVAADRADTSECSHSILYRRRCSPIPPMGGTALVKLGVESSFLYEAIRSPMPKKRSSRFISSKAVIRFLKNSTRAFSSSARARTSASCCCRSCHSCSRRSCSARPLLASRSVSHQPRKDVVQHGLELSAIAPLGRPTPCARSLNQMTAPERHTSAPPSVSAPRHFAPRIPQADAPSAPPPSRRCPTPSAGSRRRTSWPRSCSPSTTL